MANLYNSGFRHSTSLVYTHVFSTENVQSHAGINRSQWSGHSTTAEHLLLSRASGSHGVSRYLSVTYLNTNHTELGVHTRSFINRESETVGLWKTAEGMKYSVKTFLFFLVNMRFMKSNGTQSCSCFTMEISM